MFDATDILEPRYTIRRGLDGKQYAVFRDMFSREEYAHNNPKQFAGCRIACFGQFDNAYELPD